MDKTLKIVENRLILSKYHKNSSEVAYVLFVTTKYSFESHYILNPEEILFSVMYTTR